MFSYAAQNAEIVARIAGGVPQLLEKMRVFFFKKNKNIK